MNSFAAATIDELREHFPARRAVKFLPLVNSSQGDEPLRVMAEFADKDNWTKLNPEWLDNVPSGLGSALGFLSDEAICFYIPAYLVADVMGALRKVDPTFALTHGFDRRSRNKRIRPEREKTWTEYACARWSGLTQEQAATIVHYLEWRVTRDGFPIEDNSVVEALKAYWYARAAVLRPDIATVR
jgi:hypothetical protein